jgi:hypothetical protein
MATRCAVLAAALLPLAGAFVLPAGAGGVRQLGATACTTTTSRSLAALSMSTSEYDFPSDVSDASYVSGLSPVPLAS